MKANLYTVTVTPAYPTWNNVPFTVEVRADSKREANKTARRNLENEGHVFTHSDAVSFSAVEVKFKGGC